jgi:hypothetical protein
MFVSGRRAVRQADPVFEEWGKTDAVGRPLRALVGASRSSRNES